MTAAAWSRGWGARVELGTGQDSVRRQLVAAVRHPSRTWHDAPTMRTLDRWPGSAHRVLHRLAALGVIAIQTTRGAHGGVRFTFGVRLWRSLPRRIGQLARMTGPRIALAPGQLAFMPPEEPEPEEPEQLEQPERAPTLWSGPVAPLPPPGPDRDVDGRSAFDRVMRRYGYDRHAAPPEERRTFGRGR